MVRIDGIDAFPVVGHLDVVGVSPNLKFLGKRQHPLFDSDLAAIWLESP